MRLKDIVKKANGLFFEDIGGTLDAHVSAPSSGISDDLLKQLQQASSGGVATGVTLEQINKQMAPQTPADQSATIISTPTEPKPPAAPIVNGEDVDFTPIYVESNVPTVPLAAEGFLKMLADLGTDIPLPAKRTMVGTMLNTMAKTTPGVNSATIANDALMKIKSLSAYSDSVKNQLTTFLAERDKSIADAKAKIDAETKAAETAKLRVEKIVGWCEKEGNTLDDVLEFFSADAGTSKLAEIPSPFK